jgi:hypothetical protein
MESIEKQQKKIIIKLSKAVFVLSNALGEIHDELHKTENKLVKLQK